MRTAVDSGAAINVLGPYTLGVQLGLDWAQQTRHSCFLVGANGYQLEPLAGIFGRICVQRMR